MKRGRGGGLRDPGSKVKVDKMWISEGEVKIVIY